MGWDISLAWKKRCSTTLHLIFFQQLQSPTKYPNLLARVVIFSWAFLAILGMSDTHILHQFLCCPTPKELAEGTSLHYNTYSRADCLTASAGARWLFLMRKCQYAGHQTFNLQGFDPTSHNQSHHFLNILTNQQRDNPKAWIMVQTSPEQQGDKKVPALSE